MKRISCLLLALSMLLGLCLPAAAAEDGQAPEVKLTVGYHGYGGGYWRLVVPNGVFDSVPEDGALKDALLTGTVTTPEGKTVPVSNLLAGNTKRSDGGVTLLVIPGGEATKENINFENSAGYTYDLTLNLQQSAGEEEKQPPVKENKVYFVVNPSDFSQIGQWRIDTQDSPLGEHLAGEANKNALAQTTIYLPTSDTYYVWAYSRDFTDKPGARYFDVALDSKTFPTQMGTHHTNGWDWQQAGSGLFAAGQHQLKVVHSSGYFARCGLVFITNDKEYVPPKSPSLIKELKASMKYDEAVFKEAARQEEENMAQQRPDSEIAVKFNGAYLNFDVDPVLSNDRTLVPMRAIFEALGCTVFWDEETQTASGWRNGRKVSVMVEQDSAIVAGYGISLDTKPIMVSDRVMVPLRFISEAYGCDVMWEEESQTVSITAEIPDSCIYLNPYSFVETGTWKVGGGYLEGLTTEMGTTVEDASPEGAEPAVARFQVSQAGRYRMWVKGRDFMTNQPGTRTFRVSIDGTLSEATFGTHGKDGFFWQDGGVFELAEGDHEVKLLDTSGFFARCSGVLLSKDLELVPPNDDALLEQLCTAVDPLADVPDVVYPVWAKEEFEVQKTASIENDLVKLVFHQGEGRKGPLVQNEIYLKSDGEWVQVKGRTEEFGFLLMQADQSAFGGTENMDLVLSQKVRVGDQTAQVMTLNYFRSGTGTWFLPSDFEVVSDQEIRLMFPNQEADLSVSFSFDDLCPDPKVTLRTQWKQDGAYSFLLSSGDGVTYEAYDTVTAPLYYNKKAIPQGPSVTPESALFTPMNTIHLPADTNSIAPGRELTTGIVVDPSSVAQDFAYPESSRFGALFYAPSGKVRSSITAPCFGSDQANFKAGESYAFSYRIVNRFAGWYDTYRQIVQEIYGCQDIRTNYYTSLNEAIYNTTDLMMDDFYGGWDPKAMAHYNMEGRDLVTASNVIAPVQRYLLTDDLELLRQRAVPTIAYLLSRTNKSFKYNDTKGGAQGYVDQMPSPMGEPVQYGAEVYGALYEMTQGRMPFLLGYTLDQARTDNLASLGVKYKYTGSDADYQKLIEAADSYLEKNPLVGEGREQLPVMSNFAFGIDHVFQTLLAAYEFTGEEKYLKAAEEAGRICITQLWTTGYQNDYAQQDYFIDPEKTAERILHCENFNFWWHGDTQWRLGNPDGVAVKPQDTDLKIPEETVPGWLPAKAGLGAEHYHSTTLAGGTVISMNHWAGAMVRLSAYTGDEFFETQARNAMVGRFGNYVGYYRDRYITHQMYPDYPYTGPDYTSIYFHHIPVFLTMMEDFLINQIWKKSEQSIDFPPAYQAGYAYFDSYQFGQEPGRFYDEEDMWLWLDRGIVETDSVNLDYIAARKDGVLGIAFLNEDNQACSAAVRLGEKIPGGDAYQGSAVVYTEDGSKETIPVTDGQFVLQIPAKGLRSVLLENVDVTAPSWAREYTYDRDLGQTVSSHTNGKGYVIQLTDALYHAFVYVNDMDLKALKIQYSIDGETRTQEATSYPFEFLIEVDSPSAAFSYELTAVHKDGTQTDYGKATLKPAGIK